jgi:CRISPR-associated protein Cas5t
MTALALRVEAPMVTLRNPLAREFAESFSVPPPSTVYGMLLSMVGEEHRRRHAGVELALAMLSEPAISVVLRTVWRIKVANASPGSQANRRMDFQEVLTDVRFAVWVDSTRERTPGPTLEDRLRVALDRPSEISRYGGLSLGESRDLVDTVCPLRVRPGEQARWLMPDVAGGAGSARVAGSRRGRLHPLGTLSRRARRAHGGVRPRALRLHRAHVARHRRGDAFGRCWLVRGPGGPGARVGRPGARPGQPRARRGGPSARQAVSRAAGGAAPCAAGPVRSAAG